MPSLEIYKYPQLDMGCKLKKRLLTSKIFNNALTYIFLKPNEAPNEARPITKLTKTKTGAENIVKITNGVKFVK
jgi:hypothetical protein